MADRKWANLIPVVPFGGFAAQETRERAEERIAQLEACVKGENAQLRKKAGITVLIETAVNPKEGT